MVINTYNESSLHRVLKNIYSMNCDGKTEQKIGSFIFDIVTSDGNIIEIQTANISVLMEKTDFVLKTGRKIKIVHPIVEKKTIKVTERVETTGDSRASSTGTVKKSRSPKTSTIYDSLRGLTKMTQFFKNPNFSIELLFVEIEEIREKTNVPVQNQTKSRRHLKNWISKGKRLEKINRTMTLKADDYKKLVPAGTPKVFTVKELQKSIFASDFKNLSGNLEKITLATRKRAASYASLVVWLLRGAGYLEEVEADARVGRGGRKSRAKLYRFQD